MNTAQKFFKYVLTHFSIRKAHPDEEYSLENTEFRWTFFRIPFLRKPESSKEDKKKKGNEKSNEKES